MSTNGMEEITILPQTCGRIDDQTSAPHWWPLPFDLTMEIFSYCSLESLLLGLMPLNRYMNDVVWNQSEEIWKKHLSRLATKENIKYKNQAFENVDSDLKSQVLAKVFRQQVLYSKRRRLKNIIFGSKTLKEKLVICEQLANQSNLLAGFVVSNFNALSGYVNGDMLGNLDIDLFEFMYDMDPFFYMKSRVVYPIGLLFILCFKSKQVKNVKAKSFTLTKWKQIQDKIKPDTIQNIKRFLRKFYATAALSTALIHYYQMPFKKSNNQYLTAHEFHKLINPETGPTAENLEKFLKSQSYYLLPEEENKFKLITTSKKTVSFSTN